MATYHQQTSVHVNALGPQGQYISNTATVTPTDSHPWRFIFAHQDTVINTAVSVSNTCPSGTLTSVQLPAGTIWGGRFTSIKLTSGAVTCYSE